MNKLDTKLADAQYDGTIVGAIVRNTLLNLNDHFLLDQDNLQAVVARLNELLDHDHRFSASLSAD